MEKNQKRIGELQLPEEVIHHIQSFMDGRGAARTTLLSKSWHGAWLTRPNLNLDQIAFERGIVGFRFWEFTKKTMQRYEHLNLKIHTFTLRIEGHMRYYSLTVELILEAIKLGATDLDIQSLHGLFILPVEVFRSETLARLSLNEVSLVDFERGRNKGVTTCSNLKSLQLSRVHVHDEIIRELIARCPLIEELTLKKLRFDVGMLIKLHKLKYLRLERLNIGDSLFRSHLWPKFACLKELVIMDFFSYYEHKDIRICSTSLERITIRSYRYSNVNAEFDVPNIRVFRFEGNDLPRLVLKRSSREWEADVHINCRLYNYDASASWFSSLNQLLKMLGRSRVSLSIHIWRRHNYGDVYVGDGLAIPALENLTIMGRKSLTPCFLEALFSSCRPNFVTIERRALSRMKNVNVDVFPKLQSLPWKTLSNASRNYRGRFIRFQLK